MSFDLPISGEQNLLLEAVCWDKDRFKNDYMGEFDVAIEDIFANGKTVQEVRIAYPNPSDSQANISSRNGIH